MLAADNGYSLGMALVTALAMVGTAWFSYRAARSSKKTQREVESPNGTRTGDTVYQLQKDMIDLRVSHAESRELGQEARRAQAEILDAIADHNRRDDERFTALFGAVGVEDPTD